MANPGSPKTFPILKTSEREVQQAFDSAFTLTYQLLARIETLEAKVTALESKSK